VLHLQQLEVQVPHPDKAGPSQQSQKLKVIDDIKNLDSHVVRVGGVVSGLSERACPSSPKEHQRKDSGSGWVVKGTIRRGR